MQTMLSLLRKKNKSIQNYGAHQHFIVTTRKERLAAFGVPLDPHELSMTEFIPPGELARIEQQDFSLVALPTGKTRKRELRKRK